MTDRTAGMMSTMSQSTCVQKNSRAEGPARVAKKVETTGDERDDLGRAGGCTSRDGNHRHGLDRLGDLRTRRGARHVARLDDETLLQRLVDTLLDGEGFLADNLGDFGDDQRLGAIEHPLLAERQALRLAQEGEALEH